MWEILRYVAVAALLIPIVFMLCAIETGIRERALKFRGLLDLPTGVEFVMIDRFQVRDTKCLITRAKRRLLVQNDYLVIDWDALQQNEHFEIVRTTKGRVVRKIAEQPKQAVESDPFGLLEQLERV
ncbi:MAG TPA: hypothetical protein VJI96_00085 [Candidatus Andersenbacteria bacterium]|nr:hypothetical protein [Candidatus Andersenbacteria bacterium]